MSIHVTRICSCLQRFWRRTGPRAASREPRGPQVEGVLAVRRRFGFGCRFHCACDNFRRSPSAIFSLVRLTPKTEHEFLSLMSGQSPEPIPVAKPEGTLRILGTADSMGVVARPKITIYLAEKALRRDFSPRVQMVNVSVTGYEPKHELNILQFGMRYSPDVVVHSFFVGNDFTLYGEDTYELSGIRINNEEGASRLRPRHFFLADLVLNELAYRRDAHQILLEKKTGVVDEVGYLSKAFFLGMQFDRMRFFRQSTTDKMKSVFPILDSIQHVVSEGKARYVMVINPDQTQVDKGLRQELLAKHHLKEEDYDFELPTKNPSTPIAH